MYGATFYPLATAFFDNKPAAIRTLGLLVLVQLVIALITTLPWLIVYSFPSNVNFAVFFY